jgi:hypothetical protein
MAPNWFAIAALMLWPVVAISLYLKQPVGRATLWTILAAQLLLPAGAGIKLEGIPQFDKISIPNLMVLVGCLIVARRSLRIWTTLGIVQFFVVMSLIGPFITAELNGDPVALSNGKILPAETHYDALSAVVGQFLLLIPFFVGRQILRSPRDTAEILKILVIAGLLYSLPMLFEIRMSPQLHYWIYGYYPSEFIQSMREGGFRPIVFMGHGLPVAFFAMTSAVAAAALWRTQIFVYRLPPGGVTAYLSGVLVLCKTLGALIYGAILIPLVRFAKPKVQLRVALVLVTIALSYPMLRLVDVVPTDSMVEAAFMIDPERGQSLHFRFHNEDMLLQRASERLFFGWGRWGRSRIYTTEASGKDVSVTDGNWIITIGQFGLFGFFAQYGLLALSIFRAVAALRFIRSAHERVYLAALALILSTNVVDLMTNNTLLPWTWLLAGALLGTSEALASANKRDRVRIDSYSSAIKSRAPV